jgi:hypothetical protein
VLIEQREEMQLRLAQCVDAIYAVRPKSVDNNIDKIMASFNKHQGDFKLFYMNATLKIDSTERITKLLANILDISKEDIAGSIISKLPSRCRLSVTTAMKYIITVLFRSEQVSPTKKQLTNSSALYIRF